jgi:hypothetical protein
MKYALVHKISKAILKIQDAEFESVPSDFDEAVITDEQATIVESSNGQLFLFEQKLKQSSEMYFCLNKDLIISEIRAKRNLLLLDCDWTQLLDAPISESQKLDWANYRQSLRDLPATISDDGLVSWPTKPE